MCKQELGQVCEGVSRKWGITFRWSAGILGRIVRGSAISGERK